MKMKRFLSLLLIGCLVLAVPVFASSEEPEAPADRPAPEVIEGERYVSDHLIGASALYVSGEEKTFHNAYFYGAGYADSQQITDQIPNQYGMCSVVLAAGQGTDVTLNAPTIQSDPQSYSNGVFAAAMAKVTINGGSIDTNNSSGHGIDTTYMGHVYAYDTVIHTAGETSGGLASDFGGGFIQGERLDVTTEGGSSPAIFCAGTTIVMLKDSKLTTTTATGVIVAHDHSVVALENCEVNAAGTAVSGLQALPSPETSEGSTFFSFGSTLKSADGAVLSEGGGRTVMNLVDTVCESDVDQAISVTRGILTLNLWDTELVGSIECAEGCTLVVNVYAGGKLIGDVSGDGSMEINVYDGGEYIGSYAANEAGKGEDAPLPASFDDYLVEYWGTGSLTWTENRAQTYVETVEPLILSGSAACYAAEGASSVAYDPETYDPSENGVDLSLLNVGGAHGFTEAEVFGGAESRTPGASLEASGEVSAEKSGEATETKSTADMTPSEYARMTSFTGRDDSGRIYIGNDVTESTDLVLAEEVEGPAYTAVYAHGDGVVANVTGTVIAHDDTGGEWASDFSGQGAVIVANDGATVNVKGLTVSTDGFERSAAVVSEGGTVRVEASEFTVLGANPITEAYEGYSNGADMGLMLSPPWVLGIQGGARAVNMIGASPKITVIDSTIVSGGWADISTDSGSSAAINTVDSELVMLPESKGGMDSGWRIFGYDEDAYGSGYGTFNIGSPAEYFYGTTITGATMATIVMGAKTDVYASSSGAIELVDASGEPLETVEGAGRNTVVNTVFGVMQCGATGDGVYIQEGTVFNTEEAIVLHKAGQGDYYFDNAELNSKKGVLIQMMDSDDDSVRFDRTGGYIGPTYDESKLAVSGIGFPGVNYDCASRAGSTMLSAAFTNGVYNGDIYNGSGYYGMAGGNLTVTVGENATLNGDIALTSTIKGVPYSKAAMEGIAYYGDDIGYVLLDADGKETENEAEAAYIQTRSYTITQSFLQGHVENMLHYNGASTAAVVVENGGVWNVAGKSLITKLTVTEGAVVRGVLTENTDGTLTLTAGDERIPAGEYGTIEPAATSASGEAS